MFSCFLRALRALFDESCKVNTTFWVKSYGTEYQVGMYVCSGIEKQIPLFRKIDCIVVTNDNAYQLTSEVSTVYFDEHLSAFCVEERTGVFQVISVDDLVYYRPHDRQFSYRAHDDQMYIVPYCYFV